MGATRAPLVLIVSEHEWAARSLDTVLAPEGYAVLRAYNAEQAVERAGSSDPDLVFIDWKLPDAQGVALSRWLVESKVVSPAAPVILMIDGPVVREQRLEALRNGAWQVVSLPADAQELLLQVEKLVRAKRLVDQEREERLVDVDTGFYSREGLSRRLTELTAAADRFGHPLTCVVFRIDGSGSSAPDSGFVSRVADEVRAAIRQSDVPGRLGPADFLVLTPETPAEGAERLAERLRRSGAAGSRAEFRVHAIEAGEAADPGTLLSRIGAGPDGSDILH